jgi:hypothetical protein
MSPLSHPAPELRAARPVLLELFGPPGAGKSTLAAELVDRTGYRSRARTRADWQRLPLVERLRLLMAPAFDIERIGTAVRTAIRLGLRHPESLGRLARLVLKTARLRQIPGGAVLDQSILQDLWSILWVSGRFDPDPRLLAPFLRSTYRDLRVRILYLSLDPATAANRVATRTGGRSRLDGLREREAARQLECAADLPRRIVVAARLAGLDVVPLDATASREQLAAQAMALWAGSADERTP